MKSKHWLIILLLVLVAAAAVFTMRRSRVDAEKAMEKFHALYNAGDGGLIYAQAGDRFQSAVSGADFLKLLGDIRLKLGAHRTGTLRAAHTSSGSDGTLVQLVAESQFEKGAATEDFRFAVIKGLAVLQAYNISSISLTP